MNKETDQLISLSPITRLGMEFGNHLRSSNPALYSEQFGRDLAKRYEEQQSKLQRQARGLVRLDGLLLVLLATKGVELNILGLPIKAFSFALEALLLASAITYFFVVYTFMTSQGYMTYVRTWIQSREMHDSEYIQQSVLDDSPVLKMFRAKSTYSLSRGDFFLPSRSYRVLSTLFMSLFGVILVLVFVIHLAIQATALWWALSIGQLAPLLETMLVTTCAAINLFAMMLPFVAFIEFSFRINPNPFDAQS